MGEANIPLKTSPMRVRSQRRSKQEYVHAHTLQMGGDPLSYIEEMNDLF